jgi:hypothetical protein
VTSGEASLLSRGFANLPLIQPGEHHAQAETGAHKNKPEKKLPGDEAQPKEKRVKGRASEPERPNQDPQFDPSHIQKD